MEHNIAYRGLLVHVSCVLYAKFQENRARESTILSLRSGGGFIVIGIVIVYFVFVVVLFSYCK